MRTGTRTRTRLIALFAMGFPSKATLFATVSTASSNGGSLNKGLGVQTIQINVVRTAILGIAVIIQ